MICVGETALFMYRLNGSDNLLHDLSWGASIFDNDKPDNKAEIRNFGDFFSSTSRRALDNSLALSDEPAAKMKTDFKVSPNWMEIYTREMLITRSFPTCWGRSTAKATSSSAPMAHIFTRRWATE